MRLRVPLRHPLTRAGSPALLGKGQSGASAAEHRLSLAQFYELRAEVTKLLITERGFNAVATEAGAARPLRARLFTPSPGRALPGRCLPPRGL